jgi:hypothetical protein
VLDRGSPLPVDLAVESAAELAVEPGRALRVSGAISESLRPFRPNLWWSGS